LDLIVALDEASSEICSVLLFVKEGAALRFGLDEATWDEWVVVFLLHRSEWLDIEPPFLL
jgi:hypothetical protein